MEINIRTSVINNLSNATTTDIQKTIVDAINIGEEKTLPGLGVLFELMWQNASNNLQMEIVNSIEKSLK